MSTSDEGKSLPLFASVFRKVCNTASKSNGALPSTTHNAPQAHHNPQREAHNPQPTSQNSMFFSRLLATVKGTSAAVALSRSATALAPA